MTPRERLLGVHLGLLAFILITLAPLGSQLRAEPRDWTWLAELTCHADAEVSRTNGPTGPLLQVDACGYCSLLSHCPTLAGSGWPRLVSFAAMRVAQVPRQDIPAAAPHFPRARPRAPPTQA